MIILVIIAIIVLGAILYRILKEETANIAEDKKKEAEMQKKEGKINYAEMISQKGLEEVILKVKDRPEEIEKMKKNIQVELRKASKEGDTAKVREYNDWLKKIDQGL